MNNQKSLKQIKDELRVARYTRKTYWGIMMAWSARVRKLEKIELDMKESCTCGIGYNPMCSWHAKQSGGNNGKSN